MQAHMFEFWKVYYNIRIIFTHFIVLYYTEQSYNNIFNICKMQVEKSYQEFLIKHNHDS